MFHHLMDTDASLALASSKAITGNGCTCLFPALIWEHGCLDIPPPSGPCGLIHTEEMNCVCEREREVMFPLYRILSEH